MNRNPSIASLQALARALLEGDPTARGAVFANLEMLNPLFGIVTP
jgi:hypothetical protein